MMIKYKSKKKKTKRRKKRNIEMLSCNKNFVDLTVWILRS